MIDPVLNTTDTSALSGLGTTQTKWVGIVFCPATNKVRTMYLDYIMYSLVRHKSWCMLRPCSGGKESICVAHMSLRLYTRVTKMYCAPRDATAVLVIDPVWNTTDTTSLSGAGSGNDDYRYIAYCPITSKVRTSGSILPHSVTSMSNCYVRASPSGHTILCHCSNCSP